MVFNSTIFALFFAGVYLLYLLLQGRLVAQNAMLLAASYLFYGWWDYRFLGLILVSTVVDFLCGLALDRRRDGGSVSDASPQYYYSDRGRRNILFVSLFANLGILGVFKYFDFFMSSCSALLASIGLPAEPRLLHILLPMGISFYTFQTLSYTIDVYRKEMRAARSYLNFALFVTFFPQLVAGPIVRGREFMPQVSKPRTLNLKSFYSGSYLVLWGLYKKVVIADNLARLVDHVFGRGVSDGSEFGGSILVGLYAFAIQIYCDFSGYTDIARGIAKMMGFELPLNFKLPYLARTPSEFWRRWHMSLSSWIRDYVYIPLGGSRHGKRRACLNVLLAMGLCGLWHGAAWTFVLWGVYHAMLLVVYRVAAPYGRRLCEGVSPGGEKVFKLAATLLFFHLTCLGWLIFRADSLAQLGTMLSALFTPWPWWVVCGACSLITDTRLLTLVAFALPLVLVQGVQWMRRDLEFLMRCPVYVRSLAYVVLFYGIVWFGIRDAKPFIYFQF